MFPRTRRCPYHRISINPLLLTVTENLTLFIQGVPFGAQRGAFFAGMSWFHGFLGSYLFCFDAVVNRLGGLEFRLPART
jgi:hypothetical protein